MEDLGGFMSLIEKLKIVEKQERQIKRAFYVFYEGNEAEKSLVESLKRKYRGIIITPIEAGVQISKKNIVDELKNCVLEVGTLEERDRIVYLCDLDNALECERFTGNILSLIENQEVDFYYTYPCIELLCHIYAEKNMDLYKELDKDTIKRDRNSCCKKYGIKCMNKAKFSDGFLKAISGNNFNEFIKNSEQLIQSQRAKYGDFLLLSGSKYTQKDIEKIVNKNINHTTIHYFIQKLQEIR